MIIPIVKETFGIKEKKFVVTVKDKSGIEKNAKLIYYNTSTGKKTGVSPCLFLIPLHSAWFRWKFQFLFLHPSREHGAPRPAALRPV